MSEQTTPRTAADWRAQFPKTAQPPVLWGMVCEMTYQDLEELFRYMENLEKRLAGARAAT